MVHARDVAARSEGAAASEAAVLRLEARALARRLCGLRARAEALASPGEELLKQMEEVEGELERIGVAYFEERCGPHLGRLRARG